MRMNQAFIFYLFQIKNPFTYSHNAHVKRTEKESTRLFRKDMNIVNICIDDEWERVIVELNIPIYFFDQLNKFCCLTFNSFQSTVFIDSLDNSMPMKWTTKFIFDSSNTPPNNSRSMRLFFFILHFQLKNHSCWMKECLWFN